MKKLTSRIRLLLIATFLLTVPFSRRVRPFCHGRELPSLLAHTTVHAQDPEPHEYYLPWEAGTEKYVIQGQGGTFSHRKGGKLEYAWDFTYSKDDARSGWSVRAAAEGVCRRYENSPTTGLSYGKYVIIQHPWGQYTVYGHLESYTCEHDKPIKRGEEVGKAGDTGTETPHLHFHFADAEFEGGYVGASKDVKFTDPGVADDDGVPQQGKTYESHNTIGPPPPPPDEEPVDPVEPATGIDVPLIIDSSGSMAWNDPNDLRKSAATIFVNAVEDGDQIAIVDFDDNVTLRAPLAPVTEVRTSLHNAIGGIDSLGGTDIGAGLQEGYDQLAQAGDPDHRKAAVLLTDGVGAYDDQHLLYEDENWPVYIFGLGHELDEALLRRIAHDTDGDYVHLEDPSDIQSYYDKIRVRIAGGAIVEDYRVTIFQGDFWRFFARLAERLRSAVFVLGWEGSQADLTLVAPDGTEITPDTDDPNVHHSKGPTFEMYRIDAPQAGVWQLKVYGADIPEGGENIQLQVSALAQPAAPQPVGGVTVTDNPARALTPRATSMAVLACLLLIAATAAISRHKP